MPRIRVGSARNKGIAKPRGEHSQAAVVLIPPSIQSAPHKPERGPLLPSTAQRQLNCARQSCTWFFRGTTQGPFRTVPIPCHGTLQYLCSTPGVPMQYRSYSPRYLLITRTNSSTRNGLASQPSKPTCGAMAERSTAGGGHRLSVPPGRAWHAAVLSCMLACLVLASQAWRPAAALHSAPSGLCQHGIWNCSLCPLHPPVYGTRSCAAEWTAKTKRRGCASYCSPRCTSSIGRAAQAAWDKPQGRACPTDKQGQCR